MEVESTMCEIVFLIDTDLAVCQERDHRNEVFLTVFRLLSSFRKARGNVKVPPNNIINKIKSSSNNKGNTNSNIENTSNINIKWGFKFFNTTRTMARNRLSNSSFKNVKLAHLEDFETRLIEVFSAEKEDTANSKSKTRRLSHPAEFLSTALTETLHDFKWTSYDVLNSPVNHRRSNSKMCDKFSRNIFVLTKAPCSRKSQRHFSNKMVLDSDVFIDSFMSPALLYEYQQKMKISLICVDFSSVGCTARSNFQDEPTPECLSILKDTFRKLGGYFISKDVILCRVPTTCDPTHTSDSSLDHLQIFSNFPSQSLLSNLLENKQTSSDEISARLSCKNFQCLSVTLIPVVLQQNQGSKTNLMNEEISCKSSDLTDVNRKNSDNFIQPTLFARQPVDFTDTHFTLVGSVPQAVVCDVLMTCLSPSFMLSCSDGSLVSPLLQQLALSRNVGIFSVTTGGKPSLRLALLQAQNGDFGFMSLLGLDETINAEKALLEHGHTSFKEEGRLETDIIRRRSNGPSRLGLMDKLHRDIQNLKSSLKTVPTVSKDVVESHVFRSHCLNSWHVPGSTGQMSSLISKITDRIVAVDSKSEQNFLRQMQRHYRKERQPIEVVQNVQPLASTPVCGFQRLNVVSSGESESGSRSSYDGLRHLRSSSTLSRGRLMVNKARSVNFTATEDENESLHSRAGSPERRLSGTAGLIELGLQTEEDLKGYLHKQYDQVLNAGVAMETTIQTMMTVTSKFMSRMQQSNPQKSAVNFINECLALSTSKMKEKYSKQGSEEIKSKKVTEYKLQVMLILEMESLLSNTDTVHQQVLHELVSMLRVMSFMSDATQLTDFLTEIVASYFATLPRLLVDIFDELMLPLPPALAKFASPASPSSVFGAQMSVTNDYSLQSAPGSSQPSSHLSDQSSQQAKRFQKFKQHPSISDFRQKRQILVKPKPKPKVETKKVVKDKIKTRSSSSQVGHAADCESAKRNLFSADKSKPGHSKTKDKLKGKHRQRPSRSKSSRTLVLGTPVHKQTSQRHLWQQERRRQRENIQSEIQVIAESPVKDDDDDDDDGHDNSTLNLPARYIVREAFYSSNTQPSRNLARSLELAEKGDGLGTCSQRYMVHSSKSQGTLASAVRGESPMLSPKSRLLKTFLSSPSPTPKQHKLKHKHSVTTPLRRSPRKSVKKLIFKESNKKSNVNANRPVHTECAHLIFDGENASDFDLLVSPTTGCSKNSIQEGYKTPEKQVMHSRPYHLDAVSCPPVLLHTSTAAPSLNLSFRNILSSQDTKDAKTSQPLYIASSEDTCTQSPDRARRLAISAFSKSCLKSAPVKTNSSFGNVSGWEGVVCSPFKQARQHTQSDIDLICTPTKSNKAGESAQGIYLFTTPKKNISSQLTSAGYIHTTPSKVKFLDFCLISPPTGSGHPLSLDRSTPGKSILKNSPVVKGKVKRRIELQSLSASSLKKHAFSMDKSVEPEAQRMELNSSTPLFDKTKEAAKNCIQIPGPQSERDKIQKNVENKIPCNSQLKQSTNDPDELLITKIHDFSSTFKNSRNKNHKVCSSSDVCPKKTDLPAFVTICTPSSGSKPVADSINKWVRLKRSSPKNGTNSPSRLALSPANPSPSSDGKLKASSSKTHHLRLEIKDCKNVNEEQIRLTMKEKTKKRSLLFDDDIVAVTSPSKRRMSEHRLGSL